MKLCALWDLSLFVGVSRKTETKRMRSSTSEADRAIEHCEKHIARLRAEIERRRDLGHNTEQYERRLKTLEVLRAVHAADRDRSRAA